VTLLPSIWSLKRVMEQAEFFSAFSANGHVWMWR
jgi:hypothetical protein